MQLFNPRLRASRMTVGTAVVVLQMSSHPVVFGCAEVVAKRLCRPTAGGPAIATEFNSLQGPAFILTMYGHEVKKELENMICLNVK